MMQPDELKAARKRLGFTQQQLADAIGMSRKSVVEMEQGKATIERRTALAVYMLLRRNCQTCGGTGLIFAAHDVVPSMKVPEFDQPPCPDCAFPD